MEVKKKKKEEEDKKKKIHDVTYKGDKQSITFPEGKGVPLSLQNSERTTTTTQEEWDRKQALTPQERLKESTTTETPKTSKISKTSQPTQAPEEIRKKGILDKIAEWGVKPAVFTANLISGGVEAVSGYDMGNITSEEFASTGVGKGLGLATATAVATLGGIVIGQGIAGLGVAKGGAGTISYTSQVGSKAVSPTITKAISSFGVGSSKVNMLFQTVKTASPSVIKGLLTKGTIMKVGGAVIGTDIIMSWMASDNIMQGTSIMTRDLSYAVQSGAITQEQALSMVDDAEGWKNRAERFVKISSKLNPVLWPFGKLLLTNAKVAQRQIDLQRQNIIMAGIR